MSIGLNIRRLRESKGLSQAELGKIAGVSDKAVSTWEKDIKTPRMGAIQKIADHFGITKSEIIENIETTATHSNYFKIPVLGYVRAGIPMSAIEEILDYEEVPASFGAQDDLFALKITGDSMEPKFSDGDVIICRKQSDVDSGTIAVVLVNGNDATVKKVVKSAQGLSLVANNAAYTPMFYTNAECSDLPVNIIGKVIELRAKF